MDIQTKVCFSTVINGEEKEVCYKLDDPSVVGELLSKVQAVLTRMQQKADGTYGEEYEVSSEVFKSWPPSLQRSYNDLMANIGRPGHT